MTNNIGRILILPLLLLALCAPSAISAEPRRPGETSKPEKPPKPDEKKPKNAEQALFLKADRRELDTKQGIALVVGNVQISPPNSDVLITADAGLVWLQSKEAYLEGNIRIHHTLGKRLKPSDFYIPKPVPGERKGLEPWESIEKSSGDMDAVIGQNRPPMTFTSPDDPESYIAIDTHVPVSEADRIYINWADGTGYLVRPTFRLVEADRIANWVVMAPSAEGIATYKIPIVDENGKPTGKFERRAHYVADNATFTSCTFKDPHTRITATHADWVQGDRATLSNVEFEMGDVPIMYLPYLYIDFEYKWPNIRFLAGHDSRMGTFIGTALEFKPDRNVVVAPRVTYFSNRGFAYGLDARYSFHDKDIRGAVQLFWLPSDKGTDALADTQRDGSLWPAVWPAALGPMPDNIPLGERNRYVVRFMHQQEYLPLPNPDNWEVDLEIQKFSDAGVYREFFRREFETEKAPETRFMIKYRWDNKEFYVHIKDQINDFITQTEYLPQIGFNMINQPIGGGFLFTSKTQLANVRTEFADTRRRMGQSVADITQIQIDEDEYGLPDDLTLRENDTNGLRGWRFDTVNVVSRPFKASVFTIEPYVGWRSTWFEHGIDPRRGSYDGITPPVGPPLPADVAGAPDQTGSQFRNQALAGGFVSTEFHRMYDVSNNAILRRFFPYGMRHIISPSIGYQFESEPAVGPERLPQNDDVTEQNGMSKITLALRNRLQTKWEPDIQRDPLAPPGGEWYRRKLAAEEAMKSAPVDVVNLDLDTDIFTDPARDNIHERGTRERRLSNIRALLAVRATKKTSFFLSSEYALEDNHVEAVSAGVRYRPRPDLVLSLSNSFLFHDVSLIRVAAQWDINPKWALGFDVQQNIAGQTGSWNRSLDLTRRFHEWQVTFGYQFDRARNATAVTVGIGPSRSMVYRPSWLFQPRSMSSFAIAETPR